jgi:hypothetical protein
MTREDIAVHLMHHLERLTPTMGMKERTAIVLVMAAGIARSGDVSKVEFVRACTGAWNLIDDKADKATGATP